MVDLTRAVEGLPVKGCGLQVMGSDSNAGRLGDVSVASVCSSGGVSDRFS